MRGCCKNCSRDTTLVKDKLCQRCLRRMETKLIRVDIRKTCIHCGLKRTWEVYHPNWKCGCGKCQFEHESYEMFRGNEEDWEYSAERNLDHLIFKMKTSKIPNDQTSKIPNDKTSKTIKE